VYRLLCLFSFAVPAIASSQVPPVKLNPVLVRQAAVEAPLPIYPEISILKKHHGVAVAEAVIGADGSITDIKILQSPDQSIASSVERTLRSWRFRPYKVYDHATSFRSRLIFYFDLDGSGPHVTDALRSSF
jgi:TonB family protein